MPALAPTDDCSQTTDWVRNFAAKAGLEALGSREVRELVEQWRLATEGSDETDMEAVYLQLRDRIHLELLPDGGS